jgi:hypothetical protein
MTQEVFNIVLGVAGVLGGWWMRVMWESIKELQAADKMLVDKLSSVEVLVAGTYIKRHEFDAAITSLSTALFNKLDRIEDKLDQKVDK